MFWTIDRFEGEFAVLMDDNGVCRNVPRGRLPEQVRQGDVAATVNGVPMTCTLDGVLRGILPDGTPVHKGMKAGDIDPRCKVEHCYTASDKALAIGGGVLEAILDLTGALKDRAGGYSG